MNWRSLIRLGATFFVGSALSRLIGFIVFPIYTYFLPPESTGYYDVSLTYGTVIGGLLFMDVWVGVMKQLLQPHNERPVNPVVRSGAIVIGSAIAALALLTVVLSFTVEAPYVWWVFACIATGGLRDYWAYVARGLGKTSVYALSGLLAAVVTAVMTLVLLVWFDIGVQALYAGLVAGQLGQLLMLEPSAGVVGILRQSQSNWPELKRLLRFSVPLGVNSISYWLYTGIGRIAVSQELSLTENGLYAASAKFGAMVGVLSGVITLVWQQVSFTKEASDTGFFHRGMKLAAGVYAGGAAIATPIAVFLYQALVAPEYQDGSLKVSGFIVVAAIAGYSTFVGNVFYTVDDTRALFHSTLVILLVVLATTFPLVRMYGIDGANLSLIAGYAVGILARNILLRKRAGIHSPWKTEIVSVAMLGLIWAAYASEKYVAGLVCTGVLFLLSLCSTRHAVKG